MLIRIIREALIIAQVIVALDSSNCIGTTNCYYFHVLSNIIEFSNKVSYLSMVLTNCKGKYFLF